MGTIVKAGSLLFSNKSNDKMNGKVKDYVISQFMKDLLVEKKILRHVAQYTSERFIACETVINHT